MNRWNNAAGGPRILRRCDMFTRGPAEASPPHTPGGRVVPRAVPAVAWPCSSSFAPGDRIRFAHKRAADGGNSRWQGHMASCGAGHSSTHCTAGLPSSGYSAPAGCAREENGCPCDWFSFEYGHSRTTRRANPVNRTGKAWEEERKGLLRHFDTLLLPGLLQSVEGFLVSGIVFVTARGALDVQQGLIKLTTTPIQERPVKVHRRLRGRLLEQR